MTVCARPVSGPHIRCRYNTINSVRHRQSEAAGCRRPHRLPTFGIANRPSRSEQVHLHRRESRWPKINRISAKGVIQRGRTGPRQPENSSALKNGGGFPLPLTTGLSLPYNNQYETLRSSCTAGTHWIIWISEAHQSPFAKAQRCVVPHIAA